MATTTGTPETLELPSSEVRHFGSRTTPIAPAKLPAAPATKGASKACTGGGFVAG